MPLRSTVFSTSTAGLAVPEGEGVGMGVSVPDMRVPLPLGVRVRVPVTLPVPVAVGVGPAVPESTMFPHFKYPVYETAPPKPTQKLGEPSAPTGRVREKGAAVVGTEYVDTVVHDEPALVL
jgi:hypothetical protein